MTRVVGIGLLTSAFAPLVALLAILKLHQLRWVAWTIIAASGVAMLLLVLVLRGLRRIQTRGIEAESVRRADERVLAFTSSYVVPIVAALSGGSEASRIVATAALVALLGLIYVRAGLYHLNPSMAIAGFRLYEITATNGTVTMLLSKSSYIPQHGLIECHYLGDDVAIQLEDRS